MQHKVAKGLLSLKTQQTSMRHQDVCLHPKNPEPDSFFSKLLGDRKAGMGPD